MGKVVEVVTKHTASNANMATILTNLKSHLSKEVVYHVGQNLIIVSLVIISNVYLAKRVISLLKECASLVLLIALYATLLQIV